ncbi:hypothetical protein MMC32_002978 [Xylographa parallela]|nr:hypothetical protein [Xylographa parallela]
MPPCAEPFRSQALTNPPVPRATAAIQDYLSVSRLLTHCNSSSLISSGTVLKNNPPSPNTMPLINSTTLIASLSILHLTTAYYLLTAPAKIAHHNLVVLIGASIGLVRRPPLRPPFHPQPTKLTPPSSFHLPQPPPPNSLLPTSTSPALPLAAWLLSLLSISDLAAAALPTEIYSYYFAAQAPVRLIFFFALEGWIYAAKPGGALYGERAGEGAASTGLAFTWGFVELVSWFWIYVTLRDERREMLVKVQENRAKEEQRMRG